MLINPVVLPNGRLMPGHRLVRGQAAADVAAVRVAARGGDVSRMETGGDLVYTVTAELVDTDVRFTAGSGRWS